MLRQSCGERDLLGREGLELGRMPCQVDGQREEPLSNEFGI